jgi:hypothetical protein
MPNWSACVGATIALASMARQLADPVLAVASGHIAGKKNGPASRSAS